MDKKVLVLCTGNSCRSIIAEALINSKLEGISAHSSGVKPSGKVNQNAKSILEQHGIWDETYHSKTLDTLKDIDFDVVVTVCDHAQETCPTFPDTTSLIHVSFEDPDGKDYKAFEQTYQEIKERLLPAVKKALIDKRVSKTGTGVKIAFTGVVAKQNILKMVENCATGQCECMSDETKNKITHMQVSGEDGDVALNLTGDVSKEEIEAALAKSKVINS